MYCITFFFKEEYKLEEDLVLLCAFSKMTADGSTSSVVLVPGRLLMGVRRHGDEIPSLLEDLRILTLGGFSLVAIFDSLAWPTDKVHYLASDCAGQDTSPLLAGNFQKGLRCMC